MIGRFTCLLIVLVGLSPLVGQPDLDSLKRVAADEDLSDDSRLDALDGLVMYYLRRLPDSAGSYSAQYYALAKAKQDQAAMAEALRRMGIHETNQGNYPQALAYFEQSIDLFRAQDDQGGVAKSLNNMGVIHKRQGDLAQALDKYRQSMKIAETLDNQFFFAAILKNIGDIYRMQEDYVQAVAYYQRSLEIFSALNNQAEMASTLHGIGLIYHYQGDYPQALAHYQQSLALAEAIGNPAAIGASLTNIGSIYYSQGEYEQALSYFEQNLAIMESLGSPAEMANALGSVGSIHLLQEDYLQAQPFLERALALAEELGNVNDYRNISLELFQLYKVQGKSSQALEMYELHIQMRDSLNSEENQRATLRFEYEQKALQDSLAAVQQQAETELAYQAQLAQRNYLVLGSLGLLGIGLIGFFFFRYRQQQQARRRELALQQERERQAQLAELDQLKTTFFTNVSHEFRTPLTVMLGMAEQLPANIDQARSLIHRNGQRLLRLINQLLDLARLESQDLSLNLVQGDIMAYLRYVAESFYTLAQQREIDLQVSAEPEILVMDYDPEKLQDILYNLLSNALKYTPSGGEVRLAMRQAEERLQVEVADTGPGIPEKELPLVFNRFYQGSSTAQEGSSGIGLALVQALLERMGGENHRSK